MSAVHIWLGLMHDIIRYQLRQPVPKMRSWLWWDVNEWIMMHRNIYIKWIYPIELWQIRSCKVPAKSTTIVFSRKSIWKWCGRLYGLLRSLLTYLQKRSVVSTWRRVFFCFFLLRRCIGHFAIVTIGVVRGIGGHIPQIFRTCGYFVLWEAVSQAK